VLKDEARFLNARVSVDIYYEHELHLVQDSCLFIVPPRHNQLAWKWAVLAQHQYRALWMTAVLAYFHSVCAKHPFIALARRILEHPFI